MWGVAALLNYGLLSFDGPWGFPTILTVSFVGLGLTLLAGNILEDL